MTAHSTDRVLTLSVTGEADAFTADLWRNELAAARDTWPYAVVIDVSGLQFCGLAGLDVLNEALAWRSAEGAEITMTGMSRQLSWLQSVFPSELPPPVRPTT